MMAEELGELIIRKHLETDGYLVLRSLQELVVGNVYSAPEAFDCPYPLRVIGVCTREDAVRQYSVLEKHALENGAMHLVVPPPNGGYWYKVVAAD